MTVVGGADGKAATTQKARTFILALVIVAGVLNYVDRQIIAVLKPVISTDLHWTDADYGRLATLFQFAAVVAYIFAGRLVDRIGVKLANPIAVAAWSLAAMSHGAARTFVQFAAARVALGATEAMGTPTQIKTIASLFTPVQRTGAIGVSNAAGNVGAIVTPLIIPWVALSFGWRASFVVVGALGLAWSVVWLFAARNLPTRSAGVPPATAPARQDAGGTPALQGTILNDRRTWAIAIAKALSDQVWWFLLFWTPDFFHRQFGLGLAQLGPPLAVIYGCAAAGSVVAGIVSTRLIRAGVSIGRARKGAMLVCALLVTPAPLALHVHSYWMAVGLIGLMLAAHQGFSVNLFALVADIVPPARVGRVTSFGSLCGNLAGMGIVFAAGEMLHAGYGYAPFFYVAAASYLLAIGWIQLLLPRLPLVTAPVST
jgi:ACS family hexuronate transporter-like MFS transporter